MDRDANDISFNMHKLAGEWFLRAQFTNGEAQPTKFAVFPIGGYLSCEITLEDAERSFNEITPPKVAIMVINTSLVAIWYGSIAVTKGNIAFLKRVRDSSQAVISGVPLHNQGNHATQSTRRWWQFA